jgi:hypothetical protein
MSRTVECPDCHRPAAVLGGFTVPGRDGPVDYLRIRCTGALTLLVPAAGSVLHERDGRDPVQRHAV